MSENKTIIGNEEYLFDVIEKYPHVKDILIDLSEYFTKLNDTEFIENTAKQMTIKEAVLNSKIYLKEVMYQINDSIGMGKAYMDIQKRIISHVNETSLHQNMSDKNQKRPEWMNKSNSFIKKDVRNSHEDPFNMLNSLSEKLNHEEGFSIIQRFEPTPLLQYMKAKGFDTFVEKIEDQKFYIYFYKK